MTKRSLSILILVLCIVLVASMFVGCNGDVEQIIDVEPINLTDEEIVERLDEYFPVDFELLNIVGGFTKAYVVLVQSGIIDQTLRKDTINGIEFQYASNTRLYAVTFDKVYIIKDAFLDLQIDSTSLREVKATYDNLYKGEESEEYLEIGEPIVLAKKNNWDGNYEKYYDLIHGTYKEYKVDYQTITVTIDGNFGRHRFTIEDFNMLNLESFELRTEYAFAYYGDDFPEKFSHIIRLKIKNQGKTNIEKAIKIVEGLEFVVSARPTTPSVRFF